MNKTVKNSAIYLTGTVIMGILGFVNTMVLTRVLSQQVYAMYGLLTTFVTTVSMFISFGYDSSYMRFYYKHGYSQKKFMWLSLRIPLIIFLLVSLVIIEPTKTFITYIFGEGLSYFSILILLIYIFFSFAHRFTQLTVRMEERAINYVGSNIVAKSGFIAIILLIYLLIKEISFDWVLISFMLCAVFSTLINIVIFVKIANKICTAEQQVHPKELFSYGFPYMINNVLILIVPLIEKLIIRDLAGWEILGIYTAAAIFQTVMLMISNTVTNIWNPIVFKHCDNEEKFKPILHNFGLVSTIGVTLAMAMCILLRRWLVLLLDKNYYSIYIIAPTVLYGASLQILSVIYSIGIDIRKKTKYLIIIPLIQLIISVVLCYVLIPKFSLIGVAIATFISITVSKVFKMSLGLHFYNTGANEWKTMALSTLGMLSAVISLFSTSFISDAIVFILMIVIALLIVNKELSELIKKTLYTIKNKE